MELNADFARRAAVHAATTPWVPSPMAGVERRMLDRVGGEVARATSIVRYAPGSHFAPHSHDGGEEFLVLEGVFQDEHGDYPAGTYVRNPPGTSHRPGSEPGCTIFVKLWQFDPGDRLSVRLEAGPVAFQLYHDVRVDVRIEHWSPGAQSSLALPGGGEWLVLDGGFAQGGEEFRPLSWLRLPAGAALSAQAGPEGCRVWAKTGHLPPCQPSPEL